MNKKILLIILIVVLVYPSFGKINLGFKALLNSHSNDIYKSLYGTLSYGWGVGVGMSPYEGINIMGIYEETHDKGFLSYTKEDLALSIRSISLEMVFEPLALLQNEYIFHLSPYLLIEPSYNFYKENSVLNSVSGSKFAIAFGGGISIDIKGNNKFYIGIRYKNLKTVSKIHSEDINISGLCYEAGIIINIFD